MALAGLALSFAAMPSVALAAEPRLSCDYVEAGLPGTPGNELVVKPRGREQPVSVTQKTSGEIVVEGERTGVAECTGSSAPAQDTIDAVSVDASRRTSLDLELGVLEPGVTPEFDATNEIETTIDDDTDIQLLMLGTPASDRFAMATDGPAGAIDVMAVDGGEFESDVSFVARFNSIFLSARGGADTVDATGYRHFPLVGGGAGGDLLLGGPRTDFLIGMGGADRIRSGDGGDFLDGVDGDDELRAGPGDDLVFAGDGKRGDDLRCGRGRDRYSSDRGDSLNSCERPLGVGTIDPARRLHTLRR